MPEELAVRTVGEHEDLPGAQRVVAAAKTTFGDDEKAEGWLLRPTEALGGSSPLETIKTTRGIRKVEDLLARIDHGLAMQMHLWRICREPFADLSGEGARLHGGRWNSPGRPIPEATNILINPRHPDMRHIEVASTRRFAFDERLWRP